MKKLIIKKEDLKHNIDIIKKHIDDNSTNDTKTKIIAVLKGNAYGIDIIKFAHFLLENGLDFFATSNLEEALLLREEGFENDILMLSSTCIKEDIELLVKNNIILTIGSRKAAELLDEVAKSNNIVARAHLKIDTGFGRYGFLYNKSKEIIQTLKNLSNVKIEGTFSHFSQSFAPKSEYTNLQFERFKSCIDELNKNNVDTGMLHICNSCGFLRYPKYHLDAVRIGSAFLGRLPIMNIYGLKKIGFLETQVSEIKTLPIDFNVGYSNLYKTKKETKVATIPVGYMDGYNLKNSSCSFRLIDTIRYIYNNLKQFLFKPKFTVIINEKRYNIIGNIGMYNMEVDITGSDVKISDKVILEVSTKHVDSRVEREYI